MESYSSGASFPFLASQAFPVGKMNGVNSGKDEKDILVISVDNDSEDEENIEDFKDKYLKVLSIDVGIIHFGITYSLLNEDFTLKDIIWADNIDITKFEHNKCSSKECKLYHTKTFYDWIEHVIQENKKYFEESDMIIIEKQPPMGFVVIEQLIFGKYRSKTSLISPISVHKFFNLIDMDYDMRKEMSVKIGDKYLSKELLDRCKIFDRRHDITDTICMLLYFINKKQIEYRKKKRSEMLTRDLNGMNVIEKLETFRYFRLSS